MFSCLFYVLFFFQTSLFIFVVFNYFWLICFWLTEYHLKCVISTIPYIFQTAVYFIFFLHISIKMYFHLLQGETPLSGIAEHAWMECRIYYSSGMMSKNIIILTIDTEQSWKFYCERGFKYYFIRKWM